MNRTIIIAIVAAFVVIGGGIAAYYIIAKPASSPLVGTSSQATLPTASIKASDVLTSDVAKSILGDAIDSPSGSLTDTSTADISVTTTIFTTKVDPSSNVLKGSGLQVLVRVAKTKAGATENIQAFTNQPANAQKVAGIGDSAFYNPDFRQLNVLKGGNWYIITYYVDSILNATLDTDKQLAAKLQFK